MTLIQLTEVTHGDPRPFAVNPEHVMSLRPRKTLTPLDAQQGDPRTSIGYSGTILTLATGEQHFVTDDFDAVHEMIAKAESLLKKVPSIKAEDILDHPNSLQTLTTRHYAAVHQEVVADEHEANAPDPDDTPTGGRLSEDIPLKPKKAPSPKKTPAKISPEETMTTMSLTPQVEEKEPQP